MDSRISVGLLSLSLSLGCTGCFTTQAQKSTNLSNSSPASTSFNKMDDVMSKPKAADAPKREPKASTEVAFGKMKEAEADADAIKNQPEVQARLRDDARQAYQQAIKIDPNCQEAHRQLAGLYVKTGDYERAQEIYRKAMAKNPKDATLWYDLGQCHNRRKDFSESLRCFSKALELDPENREYMKKLGFTLAWTGQLDQGLTYLTRAQGAPLAHYNVARVLVQRDQTELAVRHLRLALRENSKLDVARELLNSLEHPTTGANPAGMLQAPVQGG